MIKNIMHEIDKYGVTTTVKIGDRDVFAKEYNGYYLIMTDKGPQIYDGEHLIDDRGRVYDVNLKQYIEWDYPLKKLMSAFGEVVKTQDNEITKPPEDVLVNSVWGKLLVANFLIQIFGFFWALYLIFAQPNQLYWLFFSFEGALDLLVVYGLSKKVPVVKLSKRRIFIDVSIMLIAAYIALHTIIM